MKPDQGAQAQAASLNIILPILDRGRGDQINIDCPDNVRVEVAQALEEAVGNVAD